jgi:hypothetical protein
MPVTYRVLLSILLTGGGLLLTAGIFFLSQHASQPHDGAVRKHELEAAREALNARIMRLEGTVDRLERLESARRIMREEKIGEP